MLLSSSYTPQPQALPQHHNMLSFPQPQDGMWNDVDFQLSSMPAPSTSSLSRRASTQRPSTTSTLQRGNSMRIIKPSQSASTHSSPLGLGLTSKAGLSRRMTVMGDTSGYRRKRFLEATTAVDPQHQAQLQNQLRQRTGTMQAQRPMSWCPTMSSENNMGMENWGGNTAQQHGEALLRRQAAQYSPESQLRLQQLQQWQQMQQLQKQQAAQQQAAQIQQARLQQQQQIQQQQQQRIQQAQLQQAQMQQQQQAAHEANYFSLDISSHPYPSSNMQTPYFSQTSTPLQFPSYALPLNNQYYDSYVSTPLDPSLNINTFNTSYDAAMGYLGAGMQGFGGMSTTPPTPETWPVGGGFETQYVASQDFRLDMDPEEDEGEVLVGLGLYSNPEKSAQKQVVEPHIVEMYARAGMPLVEKKTSGRGLKLEETWEPPKEGEGEDDAEGEDEDEGDSESEVDGDLEDDHLNAVPMQSQVGLMGPPAGWL